jgi:hemoglobin
LFASDQLWLLKIPKAMKTRSLLQRSELLVATGGLTTQQEGTTSEQNKSLYERFGGYDAIAAVANDLVAQLNKDPQLGRFWAHRGEDGIKREKQLLIDFLCEHAGGPMYCRGREMLWAHRGMKISESDWNVFLGHAAATLAKFKVSESEKRDVVAFVQSLKSDIVE